MEQNDFNKLKDAIVEAKQEMRQSQARIDKLVDELMSDQDTSILLDAILHAQHRKRVHHWPPPWRPWVYEDTKKSGGALDHHLVDDWGGLIRSGGALDHHLVDDWGGLIRSDGGFSNEEIQIIVNYAKTLKSALQSDIDFLDEVIEQVQDPTRAGLTPEQLARMDYISKHNSRGIFPPWKPLIAPPETMRYYENKDDYNPKDLTNLVIPRMTQKEIDDLLAKLKEQGILKSADVKVVLDGIIDMFKNMEPKNRGLVQAIAHCEKIKQMLAEAGY